MEGWQSKNVSGARVEGACADLMTGNQGNSFTQQNGKGIPQFAPNFTVYVLPPDVVCLYSEDRKFLLHGELYCALASAIAKGGKSFRELVRELELDFSVRQNPRGLNAAARPPLCHPDVALFETAPRPPIGRALGYRRRLRSEISRNVVCAFNRSMWREQRNSGPP
jgi:hypothetical protein